MFYVYTTQERGHYYLSKIILTKKFGGLNDTYNQKMENLDSDKLNLIIENILDIENLDGVEKYFY